MAALEYLGLVWCEETEWLAPIRGPQRHNASGLHVGLLATELRVGAPR